MLHVQKYLQEETFGRLTEHLGIKLTHHESLPLVILNYHGIDSPKMHPVVRECRGLVLHTETHEVVARGFDRFFNWGEVPEEDEQFDFTDFTCTSKEDGSLILIYWFDGEWRVNTRGTFGDGLIPHQEFTWEGAVSRTLQGFREAFMHGAETFTYVCEFCSPWNKVVRRYERPAMYLLSVIDRTNGGEIGAGRCDLIASNLPMERPAFYDFTSIADIQAFLEEKSECDPTFEGIVARDKHGRRFKVKSATYFALHQIRGQDGDEFNPKHLLPFVLSGDDDELLTYFPEAREAYYKLKAWVLEQYARLLELWMENWHIEDQKEFALRVKDSPFAGVLFATRKKYGEVPGVVVLREEWRNADRHILKRWREQ